MTTSNRNLDNFASGIFNSARGFSILFDSVPVGYFILGNLAEIVNVNRAGIFLLNNVKENIVGQSFSSFISGDPDRLNFSSMFQRIIETGERQQIQCEVKTVGGNSFFGLIDTCLMKNDENGTIYVLITLFDISKQKEQENRLHQALEREKKLNEMKSQFIAIASHEFRTPLSAILMSAELMQEYNQPKDEERRKKHLRKIRTAVNRLKEILVDFLSADEIERDKTRNNPVIFDLVQFIKDIIEEVSSFNGIHSVKYEHKGDRSLVELDKKMLKTCMINLMINAYKYSPQGGHIEVVSDLSSDGVIRISVRDQGIGIPENDIPHIFEQFYRAGNATTIQGTGLGLNITHKMISIMDGRISFTSKENEGTIFELVFHG